MPKPWSWGDLAVTVSVTMLVYFAVMLAVEGVIRWMGY